MAVSSGGITPFSGVAVAQSLIHSPVVTPAAAHTTGVPGQITGTVNVDIFDISNFTAITDGTLIIGATTILAIDLSAETNMTGVINTINTAVKAMLPTYTFTSYFKNPNFNGRILRTDGEVEIIAGTLEPLFGFAPPAARVAVSLASPNIVLPGSLDNLAFRFDGQSYTGQFWHCESNFWTFGPETFSQYLGFDNQGFWYAASFSDPLGGAITVAVLQANGAEYVRIKYDPATREISWEGIITAPLKLNWVASIDRLMVIGS